MELGKYFQLPHQHNMKTINIRSIINLFEIVESQNFDGSRVSPKKCKLISVIDGVRIQSLEQIKDLWLRCWPLLCLISNWSYVKKVNKCLRNLNNLQNLNSSLNKTQYNQYILNSYQKIYRNIWSALTP